MIFFFFFLKEPLILNCANLTLFGYFSCRGSIYFFLLKINVSTTWSLAYKLQLYTNINTYYMIIYLTVRNGIYNIGFVVIHFF